MKKGKQHDPEARRDQELAPRDEHAYQLLLMHEESQQAWEKFQDPQEGGDPEHARKLAAIRTELLRRHKRAGRSQD